MGKGDRKRSAAEIKAGQLRRAERRRQQRRRLWLSAGSFLGVIAVIAGLVILKSVGVGDKNTATPGSSASESTDPRVIDDVTSVTKDTLDVVGAGTAESLPVAITAPALTSGGKPEVLYVGAEYCPYCAAERWAMAVALSRFGTFTGLGLTHSSATDQPASLATLTFHGSTLTSDYITFVPYETTTNQPEGNGYKSLDVLTSADQTLLDTYDAAPYVSGEAGSIPFIDIGGKYVQSGASYEPTLLAGKTQAQIAKALQDPKSDIAKAILGTANSLTAAICATTNQTPMNVCISPGVIQGDAAMKKQ